MGNDLFSKFNDTDDDAYHGFRAATKSVSFFSVWSKDDRRLYYAYQSLNFFALSDKAETLVLEVGGSYILLKGRELQLLAYALQHRTLDYLRELPLNKTLSDIEDDKAVITQISMIEKFDPDLLLDID